MSTNTFLGLFARSPFKALEAHIVVAADTSLKLEDFFTACFNGDWEAAEKVQKEISELERKADSIKQDLRSHLPKGLFLPVDRSDLLNLLVKQDKIANIAQDIAGRIIGRKLVIPESAQTTFKAFLSRSLDAVKLSRTAINELDELLETGFRGREVDLVERLIHEVDEIEADTDRLQIQVRKEVFEIESSLNPVDVIFIYHIVDWIGDLADSAGAVASRLELLLAK
ncbi:TIGR00153 family protein [Gayadomonas joobiniege]|uniref:TIGR00153 family protein n=1 Tax=Gayadomonas joobiniege TaxID=1234606 RepID=UPI000369A9CB|nr:TIGR00153 family protein [Gayadomonas joobiniege]